MDNWQTLNLLVIHYTAGPYQEGVNWHLSPDSKSSAHLFIARSGLVGQLLPFDCAAWSCGVSSYGSLTKGMGRPSVNAFSVNIELENYGALNVRKGVLESWRGQVALDADELMTARHVGDRYQKMRLWQTYTDIQVERVVEIGRAIQDVTARGFKDVVGHEMVSPWALRSMYSGTEKLDPGPAFPMGQVRRDILSDYLPL